MSTCTDPATRPERLEPFDDAAQAAPWPFPPLTPAQQAQQAAQLEAMRAGELRGLPSCFGALA